MDIIIRTTARKNLISGALEALNSNKGAGPDGLFPKALKSLSPYIAPSLSHIFNLSLQTSQIPDHWHDVCNKLETYTYV